MANCGNNKPMKQLGIEIVSFIIYLEYISLTHKEIEIRNKATSYIICALIFSAGMALIFS